MYHPPLFISSLSYVLVISQVKNAWIKIVFAVYRKNISEKSLSHGYFHFISKEQIATVCLVLTTNKS